MYRDERYYAPSIEIIEVMVENGFDGSVEVPDDDISGGFQ